MSPDEDPMKMVFKREFQPRSMTHQECTRFDTTLKRRVRRSVVTRAVVTTCILTVVLFALAGLWRDRYEVVKGADVAGLRLQTTGRTDVDAKDWFSDVEAAWDSVNDFARVNDDVFNIEQDGFEIDLPDSMLVVANLIDTTFERGDF